MVSSLKQLSWPTPQKLQRHSYRRQILELAVNGLELLPGLRLDDHGNAFVAPGAAGPNAHLVLSRQLGVAADNVQHVAQGVFAGFHHGLDRPAARKGQRIVALLRHESFPNSPPTHSRTASMLRPKNPAGSTPSSATSGARTKPPRRTGRTTWPNRRPAPTRPTARLQPPGAAP